MTRRMLIDAVHPEEMRVVVTDERSTIHEFDFTTTGKQQIKGNIYLAKVTRVEPSLQAAFVEYGGGKQGFLPFAEIHPDYYQIPVSDRARLMEEAAEEEEDDHEPEQEKRRGGRRRRSRSARSRDESVASEPLEENAEESAENTIIPEAGDSAEPVETVADDDTAGELTVLPAPIDESIVAAIPDEAEQPSLVESAEAPTPPVTDAPERDDSEEHDEESDVETLSSEDEIERPRSRGSYSRRYKIQEVIKRNQILLVQVIKEERGNKGVSLTTFISLAGRYCVLMPNSPRGGGVSRKIGSGEDRKNLKQIISDLSLPQGMSVIIRTAGSQRTRAEIKRDFDYLVKLWNTIREDTLASSAPAKIYEESNLIRRTIRDSYTNDIEEVLVEGESVYKEAKSFMKMLIPSHAPRVKLYKYEVPLFNEYNIEDQLLTMYDPVVKLKSGGYIVMNPTEALISIDVNSGRSTGERNIEETAVKTNIEAAHAIARQLRLRDLAGLIVVDFIDMLEGRNRRKVESAMKEALRADRAKIQIGRISTFGLMEMSRQRLRPSIAESVTKACDHCQGKGFVRSESSVAIQVIRALEKEAGFAGGDLRVSVTASVGAHLLNHMRDKLDGVESRHACKIIITIDPHLAEGDYKLDKNRSRGLERKHPREDRVQREARAVEPRESESAPPQTDAGEREFVEGEEDQPRRSRRRRGGRNRRRNREHREDYLPEQQNTDFSGDVAEADVVEQVAELDAPTAEDGNKPARPRRRSRRSAEAESVSAGDADLSFAAGALEPAAEPEAATPPKRGRGRPRRVAEATELPHVAPADKPLESVVAEPAPLPKKEKPSTRKGWWQKILEQ